MRQLTKLPRILKINRIEDMVISVVFNNGESRSINIANLLNSLQLHESNPGQLLQQPQILKEAVVAEHTLRWPNLVTKITSKSGEKQDVSFEIGPDVLFKFSTADPVPASWRIGRKVREARRKAGLSQQDLASVSGTSRTYISRLENDRSDIEIGTLRKIIETGLGKKLEIKIGD